MKNQIQSLEEKLRVAMLNSDVNELDELLSQKLLFTDHLGHLVTKDEDLESHKNKVFSFEFIELSESKIITLECSSIVSTKANIKGFYNGFEANGEFRFTRVWSNESGAWQVIAGHSSLIQ